jgi:hypothetical protein
MATAPVLQALVLADHVYVDKRSGKKVIAGTFNHLWAPGFGATLGRISYAFICLTNVHRSANIELRYVDLKSNEVLLKFGPVAVPSEDPLGSTEMVVQVPPLPMPHEGFYALEMYSEEERLGALRITVSQLKEGSGR